jgi:hypothetical protein
MIEAKILHLFKIKYSLKIITLLYQQSKSHHQ